MLNITAFLNSIDSAAKETLEIPPEPVNRSRKKNESNHGLSKRDSDRSLVEGETYFPESADGSETQRSNSIDGSSHSGKAGVPSSGSGDGVMETPEKPVTSNRPPTGLANSTSKTILVASAADIDSNTRAALKKKNEEIQRLERDVGDLENQISDLKKEVLEAWANYKQVQEKAAANEMELQEEIRQIQKAKALDKQQLLAQVTKQAEDITSLNKFISSFEKEKEEMHQQFSLANEVNDNWEAKVAELNEQLLEAKSSTVQGVQNLRDELRAAQASADQMRHDHTVIQRSNEEKLSKLEKENGDILMELTRAQKELLSLKENGSGGESSAVDYLSRDYQQTQQEVLRLSSELQKEVDGRVEAENRVRFLESEQRAVKANMEDERRRVAQTEQSLLDKNSELEEKLKEARKSMKGGVLREAVFSSELGGYLDQQQPLSNDSNNGSNSSGSVVLVDGAEERIKGLENKVADLSKLLLRKQGDVVELQAERSALKSQLLDVKARCSKAEKELAVHRDLEADDDDYLPSGYGGSSHDISSSGNGGLSRRGGAGGAGGSEVSGGGSRGADNTRVIADLEKFGVKPGVGVTKAVNMIDTWAMLTGRFLRSYPLFRLGFVLYLLLLHVWVFFILLIHMERIDMDVEQQQKKLLQP